MKQYFVYILASKKNGTLYVGSTSNLPGRVTQHMLGLIDGFSKRYGTKLLAHFEVLDDAYAMVTRERQLKKWNRAWKIRLIEETNPDWTACDIGQGSDGRTGVTMSVWDDDGRTLISPLAKTPPSGGVFGVLCSVSEGIGCSDQPKLICTMTHLCGTSKPKPSRPLVCRA